MQQLLRNSLFSFLLILCGAAFPASAVAGRLFGDATAGMSSYRAEVAGVEVEKISSMQQQYTMGYEARGFLGDARAGTYHLMAGYEFNALNAERTEQGVRDATVADIESSKISYDASLLVAPGGLPFRVTLFANDQHRTQFTGTTPSALPMGIQGQNGFSGHLINADIATDLSNGSHNVLGGTLLLGIRNGSYLGAYRDILSQLPRLLVDYKQEIVEDTKSRFFPQHYRFRDLAFISLNKKDNWVHLRMRDYTDFLNSKNNAQRAQVMIGTIDHTLNRQWINLTNWIRISGDISYTANKESYFQAAQRDYLVNLFTIAKRETVNGSILSHFARKTNGQTLDYQADLPVNVNFEPNRDTLVRTRFIVKASEQTLLDGSFLDPAALGNSVQDNLSASKDFYLDVNSELHRTRQVRVRPRVEIESHDEGDDSRGLALRLGGELASNNVLQKGFDWIAGYNLTTTQTSNGMDTNNYWENGLYLRMDKDLSSTLKIGERSSLKTGIGKGRQDINFQIPTMANGLQTGGASVTDLVDNGGRTTNGDLQLYLDHHYQQLSNRLETNFEFFAADNTLTKQGSLRHTLYYTQSAHKLDWKSDITFGDSAGRPTSLSLNYLQTSSNEKSSGARWHSDSTYQYTPGRSTALTLRGGINGAESIAYSFSEALAYRIFTSNGVVRRLAEFSEEIGYEKVGQSQDSRDSTLSGSFSATYFPTRWFYAKVHTEVTTFLGQSARQQVNAAEAGINFEKLNLLASYSEGRKDREGVNLPEVLEQRWDLKVKKVF
jgi:hypothetical protein